MSKIIKCKTYGENVAENKGFIRNICWFTVIALVIMIGALVSGCSDSKQSDSAKETANTSSTSSDTAATQDTSKEDANKEDTKITYDNFMKIQMGQSYNDVVSLLGEGKESSSSQVGDVKTVIYEWTGSGMGNINVTVEGGVVTGKAQAFLKDYDAKITMDLYNKIENGMTYDQVKGILGEGELSSESKLMDSDSKMYSYVNKDGSNASFTFSDGKMDTKSQLNLK